MTASQREALENLRRVVEDAPATKFRMASCTYCAFGYASRDPWFLENTAIGTHTKNEVEHTQWGDEFKTHYITYGQALKEWLGECFGISKDCTMTLFGYGLTDHWRSIPKSHVLSNIDRLINGMPAICWDGEAE